MSQPDSNPEANLSHAERIEAEQRHFSGCQARNQLPEIYHYWSNTYLRPKMERIGFSHPEAVFRRYFERAYIANESTHRHFLSLGTGNCRTEVSLARHLVERGFSDFVIECVDLNPALLAEGVASAKERGVGDHIVATAGDANKWAPSTTYAGILANSSLHHIENLEGLFAGIEESLAPTGTFVTSDTVGRNGHMRWPEALARVHEFWRELPHEYTYNHLLQRHEPVFDNWDCSGVGFEGIRAQDILPLLLEHFDFDVFVPFANIVDPFIDRAFGPNFSSGRKWDIDFIDRVHTRDDAEIARGAVKPTHIVAAMCVGRPGTYAPADGLTPRFCVRSPHRVPRPRWAMPMDGADDASDRRRPTPGASAPVNAAEDGAIAVTILPADPKSLDLLVARIRTANPADSPPSVVSVQSEGRDIRIDLEQTSGVAARPKNSMLDVGLGRFPAGLVTASVYRNAGLKPVTVAVNVAHRFGEPGAPAPTVDYTDMWWNPEEPGWGMSIHHHPSGRLVATWLVYDESGNPIWYSLQPGAWTDPSAYTGPIYCYSAAGRTESFAPGHVEGVGVGSGSLVFSDFASARFVYEILGKGGTKEMVRMLF